MRVWGNYVDETYTGIATACADSGPIYIFRNVMDISRFTSGTNTDSMERGPFGNSAGPGRPAVAGRHVPV